MKNNITLAVDQVSIQYKLGDFKDIGLKEWVVRHIKRQYHIESFLAVNDVSFTLEKGDMLGIIGTNGSGKSTILKAIAGIMAPTKGSIQTNGTISALLELVSGFDGNLTVKENAYLRGAMLGYTRQYMDDIYSQIISFAELEQFQDRPFKQLSSGMQSRLAFSIASMVKPDILILDEVLSVGDGAFQEKSATKMREIISGGTTTILVSHSLAQIRSLCNKLLWLHHGKQVAFGDCGEICDRYQIFLENGEDINFLNRVPQTPKKKKYDYLIVGAGLFGAVFARQATDRGKKCLVIDRRNHVAGNAHMEKMFGIDVHKYGPHIFHTSNEMVWNYVNRFTSFNGFVNTPIANYNGEIYNLPINMNTFSKILGVSSPEEAKQAVKKEISDSGISEPHNLEEKAICMAGKTVYEKLIKGYTQKQWGRSCNQLPVTIIQRIPLRYTYDNRYFNDTHEGIPVNGYDDLVMKLLEGSDVLLNTEYANYIAAHPDIAEKTVYTGMIDQFYGYSEGKLEYRSLRFEFEEVNTPDYQGNAVVNYTSETVPYTRIIEHKHFTGISSPNTVITREYPQEWTDGMEPFYPINDQRNTEILQRYLEKTLNESNVIFGGRLGTYRYCNMDEVIADALRTADIELNS